MKESFKQVKRDKKYEELDLCTNPTLDESLYSAAKQTKKSSASAADVDSQEKNIKKSD